MTSQFFSRVVLLFAIVELTMTAPTESTTTPTIDTTTHPKLNTIEPKSAPQINSRQEINAPSGKHNRLMSESNLILGRQRQDKMLGYFGYFPQPIAPFPSPFYPQPNYYDDYSQIDEDEDIMSRANRRRPQTNRQVENSPIYYIRLPPTPYMFVPGYGYVSQPPRITPMNAFAPMSPMTQMPPVPSPTPLGLNPFINLPIDFLSNGKPTNIYQWGGNPMYQPNPYPQFGYPQRQPTRPSYKPKPQYLAQDSKIHNLKGQYLFNGRPDDIYVLGNSYNSLYQEPMPNYY